MAIGIGSDNVESGLVLAIDFANPKSYPGSGTTVYDLSGNGYNGTLTNGPTFSTEYGGALVFDGSNDYIQFANTILSGTGDFTISIWFRWTAGTVGTLFGNYNAGNLQIMFGTTYVAFYLGNSNLYSDATINFTRLPSNIVIKRSGTTTYMIINNNQVLTASSSSDIGSTTNFRIGTNAVGGEVFGGYYYSCAVYNRALSTAEIAQNYNAEVRRFLPTIPVIDSSLVLNLDAGNRLSFLNYGGSKGFTCGGNGASQRVDKTTYATDATSSLGDILTNTHNYGPSGLSDGATKGFVCGQRGSPSNLTTKLTYSSETAASATTANLSVARGNGGRISNYSSIGFTCGGYDNASPLAVTDRLTYSTETNSALTVANLPVSMQIGSSCISSPTAGGYLFGGASSSDMNIIQKMNWSTQIFNTLPATVSSARFFGAGISGVTFKGYILGGYTSGVPVTTSDQFNFMTDTCSAQSSANLSQARYGIGNISEGMSKGYAIGGYTTANVTTADKITFATDTTAAQTSANASAAKYSSCGLEVIYNTSTTTWVDLNPFNAQNNGTLTNGPTYSLATNGSIVFDGTNDYVAATAPTFFNNYTISCFFNITSLNASAAGLIVWGNETTSQRRGIVYWNGGSGTNYKIYSSTFGSNVAGTTNLAISTWYHATVTVDGSGNAAVYLNGLQQNTGTNTLATPSANTLKIGTSISAGEYLNGQIALVQIYNRVLSASEVLQNFNADRQRFGV